MKLAAILAAAALALGAPDAGDPTSVTADAGVKGPTPGPDAAVAESFTVDYRAHLVQSERMLRMEIRLKQQPGTVHTAKFRIDPEVHLKFKGDGNIKEEEGQLVWRPPPEGGTLKYNVRIDHLKTQMTYDARCASEWAIFRLDDIVPRVAAFGGEAATSTARIRFRLPKGWKIETPLPRISSRTFEVPETGRAFDRAKGWAIAGKLSTVSTEVAGSEIVISTPKKRGLKRYDLLAFLRWTFPELRAVLGDLPKRILIVGAGDPMFRGGLSGPGSLFLHRDRPLISRDGTSPILHELIHVAMSAKASKDGDWFVEGLAELYSLEVLFRSKGLGKDQYEKALRRFARRAQRTRKLLVERSTGKTTEKAVGVLHALDLEIRRLSGDKSLDDVLRRVARAQNALTTAEFQQIAEAVAGSSLEEFFETKVRQGESR